MNSKEKSLLILESCSKILKNMTDDEVEYRLKIVKIKSIEEIVNMWRKGHINSDVGMHEIMDILSILQ